MSPGKTASQAGHAYLGAYLKALKIAPKAAADYLAGHPESPGTKVCLQADLSGLLRAQEEAEARGIPCFLVVDSGCLNFFEGRPTVTALGIGPAKRHEIQTITRRLKLLP